MPTTTRSTERTHVWSTIIVWTLHVVCLAAAVAFASAFVLMATSLDPLQIVTAGAEPWTNALAWILAVPGVLVASAVGLSLWHWRRMRWIGAALLAVEIGALIWAGSAIYNEYF